MLFNVMKTLILLDSVRAIILGGIIQTIAGRKKKNYGINTWPFILAQMPVTFCLAPD